MVLSVAMELCEALKDNKVFQQDLWGSRGLSLILTSVEVQKGSKGVQIGFEVVQLGSKGASSGLKGSKSIKRDQKGSKLGL